MAWKGRARRGGGARRAAAAAAASGLEPEEVRHVVPFAGARDHHLHVLRKVAPTPDAFPAPGRARRRKRPLA